MIRFDDMDVFARIVGMVGEQLLAMSMNESVVERIVTHSAEREGMVLAYDSVVSDCRYFETGGAAIGDTVLATSPGGGFVAVGEVQGFDGDAGVYCLLKSSGEVIGVPPANLASVDSVLGHRVRLGRAARDWCASKDMYGHSCNYRRDNIVFTHASGKFSQNLAQTEWDNAVGTMLTGAILSNKSLK